MTTKTDSARIEEMLTAGAHFGYSKTRRHPSTATYILATKNKVDIINLDKTEEMLESAKQFVMTLGKTGRQILFVGTKPEAKKIIASGAEKIEMPYVAERWVGGILTNSPEIRKRIAKLVDLKDKKEKGELEKYTKKERLLIDREVAKMETNFSGLVILKKAEALFVIDSKKEHIAVAEAKKEGIPVIALVNSDCDLKDVDFPIIANDASTSSIKFFVEEIVNAYTEGRNS
jgi:small subunit ribosomal protein S2